MSKHTIDFIFSDLKVGLRDTFDYDFYSNRKLISYEDDQELHISDSPKNGYSNIFKVDCEEYFLVDGMYSDFNLAFFLMHKNKLNSFTFLFSNTFGYEFLNKSINYINKKFNALNVYVLDDQGNSVVNFNTFFDNHSRNNFFWLSRSY